MSTSQFPKCLTANESNIPVPRRISTEIKKSKRCAQLPELQKYIDTIIKASNECDSEDTSQSDRDKFPKERRFARYSVFKGLDNKIKQDKIKNDLKLTRSKSNNKAKAPVSEAVSRGDKLTISFVPEFEDPRNWNLNQTNCLGPNVEIEKFLKKFYPNPYHLETVTEFKDSKGEKNDLRDGTLPDVIISKANIDTQVDIEKSDKDLVTADVQIKLCEREGKDKNLSSETIPENPNGSPPGEEKPDDSSKTENLGTISAPTLVRTPTDVEDSSSSSTTSQASSLDNIKRVFCKDSEINFKKKKNLKFKTKIKPSKTERHSDYDIGKLKLLNLSDSDDSTREKEIKTKNKQTGENDAINEKTSTSCEEIYKAAEFNDIKEIYDVMNKATESFLCISSRNQSRERNEKNSKEQPREINSKNPDDGSNNSTETKLEGETNLVKNNLPCVLLKEDNLDWRHNQKENIPERSDSTDEQRGSFSEQKGDTGDVEETHQKIDDVIDFMYDCLKKFNKKETPLQQKNNCNSPTEYSINVPKTTWKKMCKDEETPTTSHSSRSTSQKESTESLFRVKNFPEKKDIQCKYTAALHEIHKKQITRLRCKRKPEIFARNSLIFKGKIDETPSENQVGRIVGLSQLEIQPVAYQRPVEVIEQNVSISTLLNNPCQQSTVERQNELGGFAEDSQSLLVDETRPSKTLLPLSVKLKKNRVSTTRLKDVLEAEEKLMEDPPEKFQNLGQVLLVNRPPNTAFSPFGGFKQPASNFVICVNSLPRDTVDFIKPTIPFPVSISLNDIKKSWDFKQLTVYPKFHSQKLSLPEDVRNGVMKRTYDLKKEVILTINKPVVAHAATHVCLKAVTDHSKQTEEFSLKSSECLARILVKAIRQCVFSESFVSRESVKMFILPCEEIKIEEKPVKALIEALEEAEEKVLLLEQSTESGENLYCRNSELYSLSASETMRNEFSETENEKEGNKKKVQELLLRTYNLQQKLQKCLQKMTCVDPTSLPSTEDRVLDILLQNEIKSESDIKPENSLPLVHWHLKSPGVENTKKADTTVNQGTTYDPPRDATHEEEEKCETSPTPEKPEEEEEDEDEDEDDDDDDRSSNYSFKSSNDFSERSETPKEHVSKRKFIKKIFNEIEFYRQSHESEKRQNDEPNFKPLTDIPENRLAHYDPKTSAKVLKTVFKGKRSSTELTIGLKDVPMTKVGNISVEKTKFSPNHTKISICISRENAGDSHNKFSSYIFDHIRPSLSTCLTDFSPMKDEASKSSHSMNQESDDDEDDYKSVGSTLGNSDSEEEKSEPKRQETVEPTAQRSFTKHRFDFYRKMNLDSGLNKCKEHHSLSNSVCRYKELEPLKQALTEMQIRMRSIKRDAMINSNDYYERALKLAKMSAGFCQSCGNRSVIPNDTFGYYRTLLPRKMTNSRRTRNYTTTMTRSPSYYSVRSSNAELNNPFYDLGINHSSYSLHPTIHSNRTIVRSSLHDMPVLFEGI